CKGTTDDLVRDGRWQEQQGKYQQCTDSQSCLTDRDSQKDHKTQTEGTHRHTTCCCHIGIERRKEQRTRNQQEGKDCHATHECNRTYLVCGSAQDVPKQYGNA